MSARFDPSEKQIADLLERFTPRQLAIGYLRAQRRAHSAETAFDLMTNINEMTVSAALGDMTSAKSAVETVKRRMRQHNEASE